MFLASSTDSWWSQMFNFADYGELIYLVRGSFFAAALLALVGGVVGVFVVQRDLAFAVHGVSELSFAGAAGALLFGMNVVAGSVVGSLVAAAIIALLGNRARERNSVIGVLMPFGLGLGVLFLALYPGRAANKFGLLTGQIVSVDAARVQTTAVIVVIVLAVLAVIWRPLHFSGLDPDVAVARGVPVRTLNFVLMIVLGLTVAVAVQIVGALLVLSLLITPAAAAIRVTASPVWVAVLSVLFAEVSALGGIWLALGASVPISPYITTISFVIYLIARWVGNLRRRRGWSARVAA